MAVFGYYFLFRTLLPFVKKDWRNHDMIHWVRGEDMSKKGVTKKKREECKKTSRLPFCGVALHATQMTRSGLAFKKKEATDVL
jgi:hypothetical protein